jgi:NADH:ubiquinone reductase (H+-translocating)
LGIRRSFSVTTFQPLLYQVATAGLSPSEIASPIRFVLRRRVLLAFEDAERASTLARRQQLLTFVVIGGGPTGVEMAGALSELARFALAHDFRAINPQASRIVLIEMSDRILPTFSPDLSKKAVEQLEELGVDVRTGTRVTGIDAEGVHLDDECIPAATVVWGAGVRATPLTQGLGVPLDRGGRVIVEPDCSIPGHAEAFAIGDTAAFLHQGGKPLPGVSPVAIQQARYTARTILQAVHGQTRHETRSITWTRAAWRPSTGRGPSPKWAGSS